MITIVVVVDAAEEVEYATDDDDFVGGRSKAFFVGDAAEWGRVFEFDFPLFELLFCLSFSSSSYPFPFPASLSVAFERY